MFLTEKIFNVQKKYILPQLASISLLIVIYACMEYIYSYAYNWLSDLSSNDKNSEDNYISSISYFALIYGCNKLILSYLGHVISNISNKLSHEIYLDGCNNLNYIPSSNIGEKQLFKLHTELYVFAQRIGGIFSNTIEAIAAFSPSIITFYNLFKKRELSNFIIISTDILFRYLLLTKYEKIYIKLERENSEADSAFLTEVNDMIRGHQLIQMELTHAKELNRLLTFCHQKQKASKDISLFLSFYKACKHLISLFSIYLILLNSDSRHKINQFMYMFSSYLLGWEAYEKIRAMNNILVQSTSEELKRLITYKGDNSFNNHPIRELDSIVLEHIHLSHNGVFILSDFSLRIQKGEFIVIIGANGSGKSSVLRLLAGQINNFEGSFYIGNRSFIQCNINDWKNLISYTPHSAHFFNRSLQENLAYIDDRKSREFNLARHMSQFGLFAKNNEMFDLESKASLSRAGKEFSDGERQKLSLIRSLRKNASLYLFDEATSNLDPQSEAQFWDYYMKFVSNGQSITTIVVTHNISLILGLVLKIPCRIIIMESGRVIADGRHDNLLSSNEEYRAMYSERARGCSRAPS